MHAVTRPLILSRNTVVIALATAFAFVLAIALLSASAARRVELADVQAHRAKETLAATTRFLSALGSVEQAASLPTAAGEADGGRTLALAEQELSREFTSVRDHFQNRPELLPLLDQLERTAQDRTPAGGPGRARLTMMRLVVHALQRHEFSALAEFSEAAAERARGLHGLIGAAAAMALLLGGAAAWLLLRRDRRHDGFITVCAWTRRVLWQGRWITFEEYLARRFDLHCTHGISDEAAESIRHEIAPPPGHPPLRPD